MLTSVDNFGHVAGVENVNNDSAIEATSVAYDLSRTRGRNR